MGGGVNFVAKFWSERLVKIQLGIRLNQPLGEVIWVWGKLAYHVGNLVIICP